MSYRILSNSECHCGNHGSQSTGAKFRWAKGKQPRFTVKVPKCVLSGEGGENF